MRVSEAKTKSGYFWLVSSPETALPGSLTIKEGGKISLEVFGQFNKERLTRESAPTRIVGLIEDDGFVTLDHCIFKESITRFGNISKTTITPQLALLGVSYEIDEPIVLDEFRFSVEGLDDWLGQTGIRVIHGLDHRTATITYDPQAEMDIPLQNGFRLGIYFTWTLPGAPITTEAKITQKAHIRLRASTPTPISDFTLLASRIANLLCLFIDQTVSIDSAAGTVITNSTETQDVMIFYESIPHIEKRPNTSPHRMLVRFPQLRDRAEETINNWIAAYERFQPALDLYFSAKVGAHRFIESRFLALAQAAETLHRRTSNEIPFEQHVYRALVEVIVTACPDHEKKWLRGRLMYGNELTLAKRLKRMIEPFSNLFGSKDEIKELTRKIVTTRNYLTHYNENIEAQAARSGKDLHILCQRLEALLQLRFLAELGFSSEDLANVSANSFSLKSKLRRV